MNEQAIETSAAPKGWDLLLHPVGAAIAWVVLRPWRLPAFLTPGSVGLRYRRFRLQSDGAELAAWHVPCEGSRAAVVLCHGHDACRTQLISLVRPLHEAGFHVLMFDFRAMGISGGQICTYGYEEYKDVLAGLEWLKLEAGIERVGVYGVSMGGSTALLAAARHTGIEAVVTDCAFARLEDMVEQRFFLLPRPLRGPIGRSVRHWTDRWVGQVIGDVDPEASVRNWERRPLLVIHGERDLLTPSGHGRRLAEAGNGELWLVPRAGHAASRRVAGRAYLQRVTGFFQRHLGIAMPQTDML